MQLKGLTEETFNLIWDSFGKYLSTKLRQGRGVKVPGLGIFTFSASNVNLKVSFNDVTDD